MTKRRRLPPKRHLPDDRCLGLRTPQPPALALATACGLFAIAMMRKDGGAGTWFASVSGVPASSVQARYSGMVDPRLAKIEPGACAGVRVRGFLCLPFRAGIHLLIGLRCGGLAAGRLVTPLLG